MKRTPPTLLKPAEAAEILRIGRSTMYRWIAEGVVPVLRLPSGDVRIDQDKLLDWLETRSRKPRA